MEFRLKPDLGGLRCAACEVHGGMMVTAGGDIANALETLPAMSGLTAAGLVRMPACKPRAVMDHPRAPWRLAGRRCPFVALSEDNRQAADVVLYSLTEHTRGLAEQYAEAVAGELDPMERGPFYDRVIAALRSEAVMRKLYPEPEEPANG